MAYILPEYYSVLEAHIADGEASFTVKLNPDCRVYRGHFPGEPIAPGVCNIQMLTECASKAVGKSLLLSKIRQCRFTALVTPKETPFLDIRLQWRKEADEISFTASAGCQTEVFITLKANAVE